VEGSRVLGQKILSAVARTGQRWGVGHVTSVLRGESTEAVTTRKHHTLSVFGLLKDCSTAEVRGYIDQLSQAGFLARTGDQYPTLQITTPGAELLRGQADCVLFRQPRLARSERRRPLRRGSRVGVYSATDDGLFEQLRALRQQLARARGVPPYVIFHDATLRELAQAKPMTPTQLLEVAGIGERKAAVYGEAVLAVIADWTSRTV
jgi:ATP-dependent DNA helicase RecQ